MSSQFSPLPTSCKHKVLFLRHIFLFRLVFSTKYYFLAVFSSSHLLESIGWFLVTLRMLQSAWKGPQRSIYKKVLPFFFIFSLTVSVFFSFSFTLDFEVHRPKTFPCFHFTRRKVHPFGMILLWHKK